MVFAFLNSRLVPRFGSDKLLQAGLAVQGLATLSLIGLAIVPEATLIGIAIATGAYISMAGVVLGNSMAGFMAFFPTIAGTSSAFSGATRFGFGALAGSVVSLLHNGTATPMILGMAVCGLLASLSYRLMCCIDAPNHSQIRNPL